MRIACVFNPISGGGRAERRLRPVADLLRRTGHEVVLLPTQVAPVVEWLTATVSRSELVIVAGGDGAVRLVAPVAADAGVPLHHLRSGVENLFAKCFGMPWRPGPVLHAVSRRRHEVIDVGSVAGEVFTIMGSIGLDADVVHAVASRRRGSIGRASYLRPIVEVVREWTPPRLKVVVDGEAFVDEPGMLVVANLRRYACGLDPARRADPADGRLDVVFLPATGVASLGRWAALLPVGLHLHDPRVACRRGRRIEVASDRAVRLQVDGDAIGGPTRTACFEVRPRALRILRAG